PSIGPRSLPGTGGSIFPSPASRERVASGASRVRVDAAATALPSSRGGGGIRWPWSRGIEPPDPAGYAGGSVLLASEGRPIPRPAVALAGRMARQASAPVHVLSIARIWGSALGLPHPGLRPNRREWQAQHDLVGEAMDLLRRRGVEVTGQVLGTRNAARQIVAIAR